MHGMLDFPGHRHHLLLLLATGVLLGLAGCRERPPAAKTVPLPSKPDRSVELSDARVALAENKIASQQPDAAISLLTAALEANPQNARAQAMLEAIKADTVWPVAQLTIPLRIPVEHLALSGKMLFISLAGNFNTLVRWDLEKKQIESVLFPIKGEHTRSLTVSPDGRFLVIERGGVTLLCNAETLKPIRDIGALPETFTPSAAVVFSSDGLLLAHPSLIKDHSVVWILRDAASGEIIRETSAIQNSLAATVDRQGLRILISDGSVITVPVSPVGEFTRTAPKSGSPPLLRAQFLPDGSVAGLVDKGPHLPPELTFTPDGDLLRLYPWSRSPSLWTGMLRDSPLSPISVRDNKLLISSRRAASLETGSPITAVVMEKDQIITGEENGAVTIHRFLSHADKSTAPGPEVLGDGSLTTLEERLEAAKISNLPTPARVLADALLGDNPEVIIASISHAQDLPPLLQQMARSRIAWLQGRKDEALQSWINEFPDLTETRKREDWLGWEQVDFAPALELIHATVEVELVALRLPANANSAQRKRLVEHLRDPATLATVGRHRLADACLQAALAFSSLKEESKATVQLATLARNMGAPPEPCLRAEALSLSTLGDYQKSHPLWISLISDFPLSSQEPGDYAEAAWSAYQNGKPDQSMEILATGIHHYPEDGNFALRAGWVSLLVGNARLAYEFLLSGQRVGFPPEKRENAAALLAISAKRNGADAVAANYFRDLLQIDADWSKPETINSLEWPEDLKITLRQLAAEL